MKPHICFFAGTKGGVGKSFAACQLVAAAEDLGLTVGVFDSDSENSTLKNLLKEKADFLDDVREDYPLDKVISAVYRENPPDLVVVDMKAGTSRSTLEWFASVPWDDLLQVADICIVGSLTADPDASRTLIPWLLYFDNLAIQVEFLMILNEKDGRDFSIYRKLIPPCVEELPQCRSSEITFPAMDKNYISALNNARISLKAAITTEKEKISLNSIMAQSRLRNFYRTCTDPLIRFIFRWIPDEEGTAEQRQKAMEAERRIQMRSSLAK